MSMTFEFWGWLRRRPNKEWKCVCAAVTREYCHQMLRDHPAPRVSSKLVLPKGEIPYLPARRKPHAR